MCVCVCVYGEKTLQKDALSDGILTNRPASVEYNRIRRAQQGSGAFMWIMCVRF